MKKLLLFSLAAALLLARSIAGAPPRLPAGYSVETLEIPPQITL